MLDIRTEEQREAIAEKVNGWIDECGDKGFDAVEPDNYDTFTRYEDYLTGDQAKAMLKLLVDHAHERGLATAQKNTADLAGDREETGVDFAVVEECGRYNECAKFAGAFGDNMILIEYTDKGMATACDGWGDKVSVVQRDEEVTPKGEDGYVRKTC
ncbi:endo alpha-1,4 polygalactosaminidase [Streptomyces sp. M19]